MKAIAKTRQEIEIHQLQTRVAQGRIINPKEVAKKAHELGVDGERVPLSAVQEAQSQVLIDGYVRLAAAQQCGWDTVGVEGWH